MTVPTSATVQKVKQTIALVAEGYTLKRALRTVGLNPTTFNEAVSSVRELAVSYARSREIRADILADEALEIADTDGLDPQTARNRIDIRKWTASKHNSKVYGDRVDLNVQQSISITEARSAYISRLALPVRDQLVIDVDPLATDAITCDTSASDSVSVLPEDCTDEPDIFS